MPLLKRLDGRSHVAHPLHIRARAARLTATLQLVRGLVVDATRVLMRGGPQGGSLDDVEQPNCVLCSTDQVAADARAVEFLGRTADQIGHIVLADKSGLGQLDFAELGLKEIR